MWVRRAERVQPPGTGGGRTEGRASHISSLRAWRDGGRRGWEGTASLQPVRSSQDAVPHPTRCAASPGASWGASWGASEQFAGEVRLCSQVVCGQPQVCGCCCCPWVSSLLAARAPSAGAVARTVHSHLITIALLSLRNMDRTVPGERKDHHSLCVCVI